MDLAEHLGSRKRRVVNELRLTRASLFFIISADGRRRYGRKGPMLRITEGGPGIVDKTFAFLVSRVSSPSGIPPSASRQNEVILRSRHQPRPTLRRRLGHERGGMLRRWTMHEVFDHAGLTERVVCRTIDISGLCCLEGFVRCLRVTVISYDNCYVMTRCENNVYGWVRGMAWPGHGL